MSIESEISVPQLFAYYWKNRLAIILVTLTLSIFSIFYVLVVDEIYEAEVLVAPAESQDSSIGGMAKGELGGLAALAGFNLNGANSISQIDLAFATLQSKLFISTFIKEYRIKPDLMAAKDFDDQGNAIYDDELYVRESGKWRVNEGKSLEPSDQKAIKSFLDMVEISESIRPGFYSIYMRSSSPKYVKDWLDAIVFELNETMRENEQKEAKQAITFLEEKLNDVTSSEIKSVIYQLIEEQTKRLMFTEVRSEYALKIIDPAVYPERRIHPQRTLIVLVGTILGFLLVISIVTARYFYRELDE